MVPLPGYWIDYESASASTASARRAIKSSAISESESQVGVYQCMPGEINVFTSSFGY